eukprot:Nk52_evm10s157 gene=Nk52_evmTU10s157
MIATIVASLVDLSKSTDTALPIAGVLGCCMGVALKKSAVYQPSVITGQFVFSKFQMLKTFLSAVAFSVVSFCVVYKTTGLLLPPSPPMLTANVIGGAMIGVSMSVFGSCPGTVQAQLGSGLLVRGVSTIAGGLCGAFMYDAVVYPYFKQHLPQLLEITPGVAVSLHEWLGKDYLQVAVPFAFALVLIVGLLDALFPYQKDMQGVFIQEGRSNSKVWSPYLCGAIIGVVQIPLIFMFNETVGTARAYSVLAANAVASSGYASLYPALGLDSNSHFQEFVGGGVSNWWRVAFNAGIVTGALLSAILDGSFGEVPLSAKNRQNSSQSCCTSAVTSFVGGAFLLLGARFADGCTSGHGVSGMALLGMSSIAATCAMFGSAIVCGVTLSCLGLQGSCNAKTLDGGKKVQ